MKRKEILFRRRRPQQIGKERPSKKLLKRCTSKRHRLAPPLHLLTTTETTFFAHRQTAHKSISSQSGEEEDPRTLTISLLLFLQPLAKVLKGGPIEGVLLVRRPGRRGSSGGLLRETILAVKRPPGGHIVSGEAVVGQQDIALHGKLHRKWQRRQNDGHRAAVPQQCVAEEVPAEDHLRLGRSVEYLEGEALGGELPQQADRRRGGQ
ncbi:hypothetical protein TYRP_012753 [Tyrophagus putrescentiae]|nr:hypothetical protein TYRP_012753 [Tyrophagus putrescentiae]